MSRDAETGSVRVVGTAHVSEASVEEVESVIEAERPDVVAVELDEGRYRQLRGETPEDLDAGDLLRGNTVYQFLAYWMLSYVQARLGDRFDIEPGSDMKAAIENAEALGIDVALVDRDIQVTIQRFWARLSAFEKLKLAGSLAVGLGDSREIGMGVGIALGLVASILAGAIGGPFVVPAAFGPGILVGIVDTVMIALALGLAFGLAIVLGLERLAPEDDDLQEIDIDRMTDTDVVGAMMEEFRRFSPGGAEALIDERDAYIAHQLVGLREEGRNVVAVVGAGHREGIERYLETPSLLPPMASITGRSSRGRVSLYKLFGYAFTLGFLVFFALLAIATYTGVEGASSALLFRLFAAWFLINGLLAFGLAKLAGAHWRSAGVGGAVAWLTSVNPLLAPGWFAGYVELRYLEVNVGDISTLNEIMSDEEAPLGQLWDDLTAVPLFKLIIIVALTNVGSFVGSVVFATVLLPYLFAGSGVEGAGGVARLMIEAAFNSVEILGEAVQ
ncbi:TraB family protein [Natronomonas moolapensis 8.8.11]|uniref:TraB family protein n=1 Tax=Natronomonas moolapensis (strain DSM 18674 / CECT 7526 / JCM 14361 / 8.8.11) TaxID=268739 RepID=M1XRR4_NATM8|nr:TraB/GumN family protein [Natronomonas moolapensis]CCQ36936.1 TraB family protein [Natronomonas moolapensis 8.8.11]